MDQHNRRLRGLGKATEALKAANDALAARAEDPVLVDGTRAVIGGVVFEVIRRGLRFEVMRNGVVVGAAQAWDHPVSRAEAQERAETQLAKAIVKEFNAPSQSAVRSTLAVVK